MPTMDEMTAEGTFSNWLEGYCKTRQALSDSVLALKNELLVTPPDNQGPIQHEILHQQGEINDLDGDRMLFYAGSITMTPPSDETPANLKAFAAKADEMIANGNAANQLVQLSNQAASVYAAAVKKQA